MTLALVKKTQLRKLLMAWCSILKTIPLRFHLGFAGT
jgi:hypothetical protein